MNDLGNRISVNLVRFGASQERKGALITAKLCKLTRNYSEACVIESAVQVGALSHQADFIQKVEMLGSLQTVPELARYAARTTVDRLHITAHNAVQLGNYQKYHGENPTPVKNFVRFLRRG